VFDAFSGEDMNEAERRQRLITWLEVIFRDVEDLLLDDSIFWRLQQLISANPRFKQTPGLFSQWMASSFIQATAVGVRRQAKRDDDSISLKRLLTEVQKYPSLVSRSHYLSFFKDAEPWLKEAGDREFDAMAGVGATCIPVALVEQHLQELDAGVSAIEHYVDRRVAHYDKRGLAKPTPTLGDLTAALRTLEKLVMFYWLYLKGSSMTTMLATVQFDWEAIFRFPWLVEEAGGSELH
jgi:hypothetical protein